MKNNFQSKEDNLVHKMAKSFYGGYHNLNLDPFEIEAFTWTVQEKLLNLTVNNGLIKKYPTSNEFCRLYLKNILRHIEPTQEIHEGIYEFLCSTMSKKQGSDDFCFRHYIIENNYSNIVTLKETKNMVINGTTGMKTWEAALLLTDWMLSNKDLFKNKKILELGSGVGFTGITLTKLCDISSITLSDCHDDVLNAINDNIQINFPDSLQNHRDDLTVYKINKKTLRVMMLDWNNIDEVQIDEYPDVLIGADIVYDPCILAPLCKVLQSFFMKNRSLNAYIACVIRNENTFNKFFQALDKHKMVAEKLEVTKSVHIDWDIDINKCIVKIKYVG